MGEFVHMELNTSDREGAKRFYESVFGWNYQDMNMPDGVYTMVAAATGGVGGIHERLMPGTPPHWIGYVGVESIDKTVANVDKAGGKLIAQQDIPGMGRLAVFLDPQGAVVAAWEAVTPPAPAKKKAAKKKATKKKATKKKATKKKAAKKKATKKKATKKKAAKKKAAKKKAAKKKAPKKKAAKKKAAKKKATKKKAAKKKTPRKR